MSKPFRLRSGTRPREKVIQDLKERRGRERRKEIEGKVAGLPTDWERLPRHEAKTVKSALTKVGGIPLCQKNNSRNWRRHFDIMGTRPTQRTDQRSFKVDDLTEESLLGLLAEVDVLAA